jgi:hypothetical protein
MTFDLSSQLSKKLWLLGLLALGVGCASSNTSGVPGGAGNSSAAGNSGTPSTASASAVDGSAGEVGTTTCLDALGNVLPPKFGNCMGGYCLSCPAPIQGIPGVRGISTLRDDSGVTSATLHGEATDPSAVCMSGTNVGAAVLQVFIGTGAYYLPGSAPIRATVDARALGITQVQFRIESPPSVGVGATAVMLAADGSAAFFDWTLEGKVVAATSTRTFTVPWSDFQSPDGTFDPSLVLGIGFGLGGPTEHYDFCIRDLKLLDANGVEVLLAT